MKCIDCAHLVMRKNWDSCYCKEGMIQHQNQDKKGDRGFQWDVKCKSGAGLITHRTIGDCKLDEHNWQDRSHNLKFLNPEVCCMFESMIDEEEQNGEI